MSQKNLDAAVEKRRQLREKKCQLREEKAVK